MSEEGKGVERGGDGVAAALTPEEWATLPLKVYFRPPKWRTALGYSHMVDEGWGIELHEDGALWVWDDSWAVSLAAGHRHAVAAVALHGQPFGFTREDVVALLGMAMGGVDPEYQEAVCRSLASRIEALLPPLHHPD